MIPPSLDGVEASRVEASFPNEPLAPPPPDSPPSKPLKEEMFSKFSAEQLAFQLGFLFEFSESLLWIQLCNMYFTCW
jgi:hypothetical protein